MVTEPKFPARGTGAGTVLGVAAIVLWGSTVALARRLSEELGPLGAAGAVYLVSGTAAAAMLALRRDAFREILRLPRRHLAGCGALFVFYVMCFYLALGRASGRQQAIEVGIINHLWPVATVVFSVPLLGRRARWFLTPGAILALAGIVLVTLPRGGWDVHQFRENMRGNALPYALALLAGLDWGIYSNLSRRWAGHTSVSAVPLFLAVTGVVMGLFWCLLPGPAPRWSPRTLLELLFLGGASTTLGYIFWDIAMRRGNQVLVASLACLVPLLSAVASALYLRVTPGAGLWAGCVLLIAGAVLCRKAVGGES
ncbi:MAG: aromatic amino acid DMT transporter YddG [Planctomycetota bacterium]